MRTIIAQVCEQNLKDAVKALASFAPPEDISIYEPVALPEDSEDDALDELAQKVVTAVRPQPTQPMRRKALRKLLGGHDTFVGQGGEADPALRNAMGAISKALHPVFNHSQAVRRLAVPRKTRFPDGSYKGTTYVRTKLGHRVKALLEAEKSI
jgi:hypothetical protein